MTPPVPGPREGLNAAVAAQLRAEKAAAGITNDDLARISTIPKASVQRYLAADRHIDVAVLALLAEALRTTPRDVVIAAATRLERTDELAVRRASRGRQDAGLSDPAGYLVANEEPPAPDESDET